MRVAVVSTYPPRPCGIATFTQDLRRALLEADGSTEVCVAAITSGAGQDPAPEVAVTLRQHSRTDHVRAADALNDLGVDVVLLEHEFGIYGGESGQWVLDLVGRLEAPSVVTLHTVLGRPSALQSFVLAELCHQAAQVTVFTETARGMLTAAGLAAPERVSVVNHGAPVQLRSATAGGARRVGKGLPELDGHPGRTVLSTFGLLSAGKGIETAIRALPPVVRRHPELLYVVAGRTHPEVARLEGERYREGLERLVDELGLSGHVLFVDRFLTDDEVQHLLGRTEVFLTPYRSEEQVVSGVLTFALAAGCPVVSTPYRYAADLLSSGAGLLVPFDDPGSIADAVGRLLDDPQQRQAMAERAHTIGASHTWPEVGRGMLETLGRACERPAPAVPAPTSLGHGLLQLQVPGHGLPLAHLRTLVEPGGMVQHANGLDPDRSTGYCVDDLARLAMVATATVDGGAGDAWLRTALRRSLVFLGEAWDVPAGAMHNFRAVDGSWLDRPHHGDHVGRAVWALGEVVAAAPDRWSRSTARALLEDVLAPPLPSEHLRPLAFALLGLARLPQRDAAVEALSTTWAGALAASYRRHRSREWRWFEDHLTYDNARLSQALLATAGRTGDPVLLAIGLESLDWYAAQCGLGTGPLRLVGNEWRRRPAGEQPSSRARPGSDQSDEGDEQPLDAAALVEAFVEAYLVTGDEDHLTRARWALGWFHGRNRLGLPVVDEESGGCHDGLGANGLNANEGAESTLAYLQASLALGRVRNPRRQSATA